LLHTATLHLEQRAIFCPAPLLEGVSTISGSVPVCTTKSASIIAFSA
jgi:hypothetical protein